MPRTLSRLRYRKPPVPVAFHGRDGRPLAGPLLEQRVTAFVNRQSNPRHVRLQVVANPKARLPATGQTVVHPLKPFTLKDVVDPEGQARHGEIIYIFRNIKTNQIIYSLQELLNVCAALLRSPWYMRAYTVTGPSPRTAALHRQALETTRSQTRRMDTALCHYLSHPRARLQCTQEAA
jgi:hypothetical protein